MRLEHLCDMDFTYRREPLYDDLLKLVVPYGTQEASLYGEGDAVFRGIYRCVHELDCAQLLSAGFLTVVRQRLVKTVRQCDDATA